MGCDKAIKLPTGNLKLCLVFTFQSKQWITVLEKRVRENVCT